jgi:hypothetical protein
VARIDHGTDTNGEAKNEVRTAVTPDHRDYAQVMGHHTLPTAAVPNGAPAAPVADGADSRPAWAR